MTFNYSARRTVAVVLVCATFISGGCSWLRGSTGYESSPESRPLEVPPDLDAPSVDRSMEIPAVAGAAPRTAGSAPATGQSFVLSDSAEGAWRRLGLALDRIEGVTVTERAQVLSVYNVTYQGESFLIRLAPDGEATRISAVSQEGRELTTGAAGRLLALLKARLG